MPGWRRLPQLFELYASKTKGKDVVMNQLTRSGTEKSNALSVKLVQMSGVRARHAFRVFATIVDALGSTDDRFISLRPVVRAYAAYYRALTSRDEPPPTTSTLAAALHAFDVEYARLLGDDVEKLEPLTRAFDFDQYENEEIERGCSLMLINANNHVYQHLLTFILALENENDSSSNADDDEEDNNEQPKKSRIPKLKVMRILMF